MIGKTLTDNNVKYQLTRESPKTDILKMPVKECGKNEKDGAEK